MQQSLGTTVKADSCTVATTEGEATKVKTDTAATIQQKVKVEVEMNTQPTTEVKVETKAKKTKKKALRNDSVQMLYTEEVRPIATRVVYEMAADSAISEKDIKFPEFITEDFDKQLSNWQAQTYLQKVDKKQSKNKDLNVSDTIYAKRLASMPTIVRMPYNNMVRTFIDTYVKRGHRQVSFMLGVSELYMPIFDEEINRAGIPYELRYLPIIESGLNATATSFAGARGLWQFMIGTGNHYGLKSNNYIDERLDPIKSTEAAVRYLKDLYKMFNNWELAIASYNCGPGNVKKAIIRSGGSTDFWKIYDWLPAETRGYLPAFIAANYAMTFYNDHGITPMTPKVPITTDTVHVNKNLHFNQIVEVCGIDIEEIRALNPQYLKDIIPGANETYVLRLTNESITKFVEKEDVVYKHDVDKYFPPADIAKMLNDAKLFASKRSSKSSSDSKDDKKGNKGKNSKNSKNGKNGKLIKYKIKPGDTLGGIAIKHDVTVKQIMKWNNMKDTRIRDGKFLNIYK
jgi:membrane-bound lytic murein transglycosylase D